MQSVFHSSSISQLIEKASKKIDRLDAQLLLAHVLKQPRAFLIAHGDEKIGKIDIWKFEKLVQKRKREIPLAYLTGHKEFFGLDFFVNTHTLIPRPDTEVMIEQVLEQITQSPDRPITYIDIGTGSGCIPIAIAQTLTDKRKQLKIFATDISRKALRVAKKNAQKHTIDITYLHGNLLEPWVHRQQYNNRTIEQFELIITANLPYLTQTQFDEEPSIQHEPHAALVADNNGLALYEELLCQMKKIITNYQLPITVFLEIDPSQTATISKMITHIFPKATIHIQKDLSGKDRVVTIIL